MDGLGPDRVMSMFLREDCLRMQWSALREGLKFDANGFRGGRFFCLLPFLFLVMSDIGGVSVA